MRLVGQLGVLGRFQRALLKDLEPIQILCNLLEVATEEGVERAALFLYHPKTRELVGEVASGRGRHYTVSAIALPLYQKGPVQEAFFAEGPVRREELSPSAQESVDLILESAFRLKTMVDNLLDTSRLEAGRFEVARRLVNLKPLLADLARSFRGVARLSGVAFQVELSELPILEADPDRVVQVVGNLLSNAFKFTPPGGRVRFGARQEGEALVLEVGDTGPGIPEEELPKLFQRYARAENARARGVSGTGLGLFISKHIVEAHGGRIEVQTQVGKGSLFRVILPLYGPHPVG